MENERALADRANRLYWESETSVNRIAEDLGLSKGALYNLVEPLATELRCPECGLEMAFLNRTARLKGFVGCAACGFEAAAEKLEGGGSPGAAGKGTSAKGSAGARSDAAAGRSTAGTSAKSDTAPGPGRPSRPRAESKPAPATPSAPAAPARPATPAAHEGRKEVAGKGATGKAPDEVADAPGERAREPVGSRASGKGSRSSAGEDEAGGRPIQSLVDFSRVREAAKSEQGRNILAGGALLGIAAGVLIVRLIRNR